MHARAHAYMRRQYPSPMFSPYKNISLDSEEYDGICESKIQARSRSNVLQAISTKNSSSVHLNIIGAPKAISLNFV